jgi:ADP-heptose:LPS heptosyltransferase
MTRPKSPRSPLRGRYLVRNPLWNAWLRVNDSVLRVLHDTNGEQRTGRSLKRVLVAVGGHLGDAVIATAHLSQLSRALPGAEIGIVCGSWSRRVFEGHPRVKWIHVVDYWKLNRGAASVFARWLAARRTRARALREIRDLGYDAAIDLAAYFPNSARLLWKAGIPVRVGYTSGGDGPLYTHAVPWSARNHVVDEHAALLAQLVPSFGNGLSPQYELGAVPETAAAAVAKKLESHGLARGSYVVVHMGAGQTRKEWPSEKWTQVLRELAALGIRAVLTGAGASQSELARRVAETVPGTVNLSDQLDWNEFRAVVADARLVLSVDTVAAHLAGVAGTPCVVLMTGMDEPRRWIAIGAPVTILSEKVPCAPCYRSRGCADMSCIRDITAASVVAAARRHLSV